MIVLQQSIKVRKECLTKSNTGMLKEIEQYSHVQELRCNLSNNSQENWVMKAEHIGELLAAFCEVRTCVHFGRNLKSENSVNCTKMY